MPPAINHRPIMTKARHCVFNEYICSHFAVVSLVKRNANVNPCLSYIFNTKVQFYVVPFLDTKENEIVSFIQKQTEEQTERELKQNTNT